MRLHNKIVFLTTLFLITSLFDALAKDIISEQSTSNVISEFPFDANDNDDDGMPYFCLSEVRSFDPSFEAELTTAEKLYVARLYVRSKFFDCRSAFARHFQDHSNEYLLGGACILAVILASALRSSGYLKASTHGTA